MAASSSRRSRFARTLKTPRMLRRRSLPDNPVCERVSFAALETIRMGHAQTIRRPEGEQHRLVETPDSPADGVDGHVRQKHVLGVFTRPEFVRREFGEMGRELTRQLREALELEEVDRLPQRVLIRADGAGHVVMVGIFPGNPRRRGPGNGEGG